VIDATADTDDGQRKAALRHRPPAVPASTSAT
jgi:hypothetical protein